MNKYIWIGTFLLLAAGIIYGFDYAYKAGRKYEHNLIVNAPSDSTTTSIGNTVKMPDVVVGKGFRVTHKWLNDTTFIIDNDTIHADVLQIIDRRQIDTTLRPTRVERWQTPDKCCGCDRDGWHDCGCCLTGWVGGAAHTMIADTSYDTTDVLLGSDSLNVTFGLVNHPDGYKFLSPTFLYPSKRTVVVKYVDNPDDNFYRGLRFAMDFSSEFKRFDLRVMPKVGLEFQIGDTRLYPHIGAMFSKYEPTYYYSIGLAW